MWERLRYTLYAPLYDRVVQRFEAARAASIQGLALAPGERVLLIGAGTGLDIPYIPDGVDLTATDINEAMLERARSRAAALHRPLTTTIMDGQRLAFPDSSFDTVILHLILAVIPDPILCLQEAVRVLRPGGRIAIFDKFAPVSASSTPLRRVANGVVGFLATDINRAIEPMLATVPLTVTRDAVTARVATVEYRTIYAIKVPRPKAEMEDVLRFYGVPQFIYEGRGNIQFADGEVFDCWFKGVQTTTGRIACYAISEDDHTALHTKLEAEAPVDRVAWRTSQNWYVGIETQCRVSHARQLDGIPHFIVVADAIDMRVSETGEDIRHLVFGMVNMHFGSPDGQEQLVLPLNGRQYVLEKQDTYFSALNTIKVQRTKAVTCHLRVRVEDPTTEHDACIEDVLVFTQLFSVALGTEVEWMYLEEYTENGDLIGRFHRYIGLKPFVFLPVIPTNDIGTFTTFVLQTYPVFVQRCEAFGLDIIISAWLDSRLEQPHLQIRGVTLAVVTEMFKRWYVKRHANTEFLVSTATFAPIIPDLQVVLLTTLEQRLPSEDLERRANLASRGKIKGLTRAGFRSILKGIVDEIGLRLTSRDRTKFVDSRDYLVHQGEFYSIITRDDPDAEVHFPGGYEEEFYFLQSAVDRMVLKTLGYSGSYIARSPHGETIQSLP